MKKNLFTILILMQLSAFAQNTNSFNVHFDLDKWNLTDDATTQLDSFISANISTAKIKLYGHCDIMASYEYNDALSMKRTDAVKKYLVSKGFNAENIIEEKGFGKRRPLNKNHGEIEMYLNRRVEILINESNNDFKETDVVQKIVEQAKPLEEQIKDSATKIGDNIILSNMNFYGGTHTILPESLPTLMDLIKVMKSNPALEIAVEGHICCQDSTRDGYDIGTHTFNLSENRAKEICFYLNKNGVASGRLKYKGFGHANPIFPYPEKSETERIMNRRVEIKILSK